MSESFTIEVNKAEIVIHAKELLEGTALWNQIQGKIAVDWKAPGESALTVAALVSNVIAAVEVVKSRLVAIADPDGKRGLKVDGKTALEAAVAILDEVLVFKGSVGAVVEMFDRPILVFLIETAFAARKGANWLGVAKILLGII